MLLCFTISTLLSSALPKVGQADDFKLDASTIDASKEIEKYKLDSSLQEFKNNEAAIFETPDKKKFISVNSYNDLAITKNMKAIKYLNKLYSRESTLSDLKFIDTKKALIVLFNAQDELWFSSYCWDVSRDEIHYISKKKGLNKDYFSKKLWESSSCLIHLGSQDEFCKSTYKPKDTTVANILHVEGKDALSLAEIVYPCIPKKNDKPSRNYKTWMLSELSSEFIKRGQDTYRVSTWNEINNPLAVTQYGHYNRGGFVLLKNGAVIYKSIEHSQYKIKKLVALDDSLNLVFENSEGGGMGSETYTIVYRFSNNMLKNVFFEKTGSSDLASSGTYHTSSDIEYIDLNKDGIKDMVITIKDHEIKDYDLTGNYKVISTQKIIFN